MALLLSQSSYPSLFSFGGGRSSCSRDRGGAFDFQGQGGVLWAERGQGAVKSDLPLETYLTETPSVWYKWSISEEWRKTETYRDKDGNRKTRTKSGWRTVDSEGVTNRSFSRMIRANCSLNRKEQKSKPRPQCHAVALRPMPLLWKGPRTITFDLPEKVFRTLPGSRRTIFTFWSGQAERRRRSPDDLEKQGAPVTISIKQVGSSNHPIEEHLGIFHHALFFCFRFGCTRRCDFGRDRNGTPGSLCSESGMGGLFGLGLPCRCGSVLPFSFV